MNIPIHMRGSHLIVSIESVLCDEDLIELRDELVVQVGKLRSQGVIVDVTKLDVMDSFAAHTLLDISQLMRLHGAEMVIVGIQPDVAFTLARFGLNLESITTLQDLEEGIAHFAYTADSVHSEAHSRTC
jgi:rsbT antagonist protein RsbS